MCARSSEGGHSRAAARARCRAAAPARRVKREVHQPRSSAGSPRTRWAMMLRWISRGAAGDRVGEAHEEAVRPAAVLLAALGVDRPRRTGPGSPCPSSNSALPQLRASPSSCTSARAPTSPARTRRSPCSRARAGSRPARTPRPMRRRTIGSSVDAAPLAPGRRGPSMRLLEPGDALDPEAGALVGERALRDAPAVVELADEVRRAAPRRR